MASHMTLGIVTTLVASFIWIILQALLDVFFNRISGFPGPKLGAATKNYKAYTELVKGQSWHLKLEELHRLHGPVVRVGPNELHFAEPQAYHDIYNNTNRWDKEESLYHSFGEDRSSFGFLSFRESKERKDVLGKSFSQKAILDAKGLVQEKVDTLCRVFERLASERQTVNLSRAYRCMTMDIITYYCFGKSVNSIEQPRFNAPIIIAMDASLPVFIAFKHSSLIKNGILRSPRPISRLTSPATAGLVDLQELLENQIKELSDKPETIELLPHRQTIYHSLLDPKSWKNGVVPSQGSLYEEAQALMFAGADTVGMTLKVATFHMLRNRQILDRFRTELRTVYPDAIQPPAISALESLPYFNACIKEALRMNSGVISGLPRIVPATGAKIAGHQIPGGTIVSMGSTFVHYNSTLFPDPFTFRPERWLDNDKLDPNLDNWLVAFSRGPRSCLGINLAWLELRLTMATVFSRFNMQLDPVTAPKSLRFREAFLPMYLDGQIEAYIERIASPSTNTSAA